MLAAQLLFVLPLSYFLNSGFISRIHWEKSPKKIVSNADANLRMPVEQSDLLLPAERVGNSMRLPIGKRVKTSFPLRRSLRCHSLFIC